MQCKSWLMTVSRHGFLLQTLHACLYDAEDLSQWAGQPIRSCCGQADRDANPAPLQPCCGEQRAQTACTMSVLECKPPAWKLIPSAQQQSSGIVLAGSTGRRSRRFSVPGFQMTVVLSRSASVAHSLHTRFWVGRPTGQSLPSLHVSAGSGLGECVRRPLLHGIARREINSCYLVSSCYLIIV